MMTLYGYWRSSASYRVRLALALKGLDVNHVAINLRRDVQSEEAHLARNPQGFVPVLELEDGTTLTQSVAIIDYLEVNFPEPSLLPADPILRSKMLAASLVITSDIAPIQNLSVLNYLKAEHDHTAGQAIEWAAHWISKGFKALEKTAQNYDTSFLMTDRPMLFECCLIPQVYNAKRFGVDMNQFPRLSAIDEACRIRPEVISAHPQNQADAV